MPNNKNASSYIADKKYAFTSIKAAEAAERLGIDLNLAELNPSNNIAFANTSAAKNKLASEGVKLHNKNIDDKVKEIIRILLSCDRDKYNPDEKDNFIGINPSHY